MFEKLKLFLGDDQVFYSILVVLVGVTSFMLGRVSTAENPINTLASAPNHGTVSFESANGTTSNVMLVGSLNGTKYHFPWCPGASQIKSENQVTFTNKIEAENRGYSPAENCSGL